jgi:tetratricopeptide (TPR) repeat protein
MFRQLNIFSSKMNSVTLSPSMNSGQALSKCDTVKPISLRQVQTDKVSNLIQTCTILVILLFGISDLTLAQNIDEQMLQGGEYYRNGEFDNAIKIYEELISDGYEGISLYFNLANSYYRIGQLGYAVLNYERALKLSPSDEDVKHNLAFANLSTIDRIQPLPTFFLFEWWESILTSLTVNGWTYLAYIFFILLIILIVIYFFAKTTFQQKLILFSGLGMLAIFLMLISLLIVKINREENVIEGVVIEQSLTVKTSPDPKSTDAFVIHEGLKVNLEDQLDEWIKIRLADGKVGWVENDAVERI